MFTQANSSKSQPSSQSTGFASRSSGSLNPHWCPGSGRLDRREQSATDESLEEQRAGAVDLAPVRHGFVPTLSPVIQTKLSFGTTREPSEEVIRSAAVEGVHTPAVTLPFLDRIQTSFGRHSIDHAKAHVGPEAAKASRAMNALAFASGDHVVFGVSPDLRTTAHEAAHVVQQQAGVQLAGGIGREGDAYERHADAVADAVVAGRSAGGLLDILSPQPKIGNRAIMQLLGKQRSVDVWNSPVQASEALLGPNQLCQAIHGKIFQTGQGLTIQRAVPETGDETEKPQAQTGSYKARGGEKFLYFKDRYPRSSFSFGSNTRFEVLSKYNPQMAGNTIISIKTVNGDHVNVEGVQLDHKVSWEKISAAMDKSNKSNNPLDYTLYDAKMYYNDQDNLQPVLGALNASAGAQGVRVSTGHSNFAEVQGIVQKSWMNLQSALIAVENIDLDSATQITEVLIQISRNMDDLVEELYPNRPNKDIVESISTQNTMTINNFSFVENPKPQEGDSNIFSDYRKSPLQSRDSDHITTLSFTDERWTGQENQVNFHQFFQGSFHQGNQPFQPVREAMNVEDKIIFTEESNIFPRTEDYENLLSDDPLYGKYTRQRK